MSVDAVYNGRRVYRVIDETSEDANIGPRLDYGDGRKPQRVEWGDFGLIIDPSDEEWEAAVDLRIGTRK